MIVYGNTKRFVPKMSHVLSVTDFLEILKRFFRRSYRRLPFLYYPLNFQQLNIFVFKCKSEKIVLKQINIDVNPNTIKS